MLETLLDSDPVRLFPEKRSRAVAVALLVPLFLTFPGYLLFVPDLPMVFFLPWMVGLLCAGCVLILPRSLNEKIREFPWYITLILVFFVGLAFRVMCFSSVGMSLLSVTMPLAACLVARELRCLIPPVFACLWLWNTLFVMVQTFLYSMEYGGITGNRNWTAALLIVTLPFVWKYALRWSERLPVSFFWKRWILPVTAVLLTFCQLIQIASRASAVALICACLLMGILMLPSPWRRRVLLILCLLLLLLSVGIYFLFPGALMDYASSEERILFWDGALRMISDAPAFGWGMDSFEQTFLSYRSMAYHLHPHAALRTNHPHNEMLFLAAGVGICGLLAWLTLVVVPLVKQLTRPLQSIPGDMRCMIFALLYLLFHGQLDLVLFQAPTSYLALLLLGLLWEEAWPMKEHVPWKGMPFLRRCLYVAGAAIFLLTGWFVCRQVIGESSLYYGRFLQRAGRIPEARTAYLRAATYGSGNAEILYPVLTRAANLFQEPKLVLETAEKIRKTNRPDYAHVNLYAGLAHAILGEYGPACELLARDADLYPAQVTALFHLERVLRLANRVEEADGVRHCLVERMSRRNLDFYHLQWILRNNEYDLKPMDIPPREP